MTNTHLVKDVSKGNEKMKRLQSSLLFIFFHVPIDSGFAMQY